MTNDVAPGDSRLAGAVTLPARVLRKYHKGLVAVAVSQDSEAFDDLVADGVMEMVRFHRRTPAEEDGHTFMIRAAGWLIQYYRRRYRKMVGLYNDKKGTLRKKEVLNRVDFEGVKHLLTVRDNSALLWIEVEDFLEGLRCEGDGGLLRWGLSSGGRRGRQPSASKRWPRDDPDSGVSSSSPKTVPAV